MPETTPPILPGCLLPDWEANPTLQDRHAELQRTNLEDYGKALPQTYHTPAGLHYADTFKDDPQSVEDETSAVIVPIPFATGWRPHTAARVDLLNAALGGGQRIISLPNSVHGMVATQCDVQERRAVARGDFGFLSERVLRLLDAEQIERVRVAGYSQGSVIGADIARSVARYGDHLLEAVALSDMPTLVPRRMGRLALDFVRTGMTSYIKAMDATTIPFLRESVTTPTTTGQMLDLARYMRTVTLPENLALARGMRFATFGSAVLAAARNNGAQFGFMRAEHSTVTPKQSYEKMVRYMHDHLPGRVQSVEIPGYGHEFGDHSVALALVEARVLALAR